MHTTSVHSLAQATFERLCLPPSAMAAAVVQRSPCEQRCYVSEGQPGDKDESEEPVKSDTGKADGDGDGGLSPIPCNSALSVNWMQV